MPLAAEGRVDRFIDKFDRKHQTLIPAVRKALRKRCRTAHELAYGNYRSVQVLARPEVEALVAAAVAPSKTPFPTGGRGHLIIRSVSARQRPRRRPPRQK
jgi:hypothetical protein